MIQLRKKYIYFIFILKEYMLRLIGMNYSKEIIMLIIMFIYKPTQISCGLNHNILLSDKIYVWGRNDYGQLWRELYDCFINIRKIVCMGSQWIRSVGLGHTKDVLPLQRLKI